MQKFINDYLKLFSLNSNSSLNDLKKAYRKLAKKNHPDRFIDKEQKKKQEKIMTGINEAYQKLLMDFEKIINEEVKKESNIENDYALYKKGVDCYKIYFDSFFQLFSKRAVKTLRKKESILLTGKTYFIQLLREYPKSVWVEDSKEKLKKIEKTILDLDKAKEVYKNLNLKDSRDY
jgi:DnaJ domain